MRRSPTQPRAYVPELPPPGGRCTVPTDQVQHLVQVLRLTPGDRFLAFDGRGQRRLCRLEHVERGRAATALVEETLVAPPGLELPHALELRVAPPRAAREESLVRSAVELGATRLSPLVARRGVRNPTRRPQALQRRWARWAIEACKQCGRDLLPEVTDPWSPGSAQASLEDAVVLHPSTPLLLPSLLEERLPGPVIVIVGPEGGLAEEEIDLLRSRGCRLAGLGPVTLRVETAALAALATAATWLRTRGSAAGPAQKNSSTS